MLNSFVPKEFKEPAESGWRQRVYEVVFEAETRPGKLFDISLIVLILLSVAAVFLESVRSVREVYGPELYAAEWAFTVLFTIEYVLRLVSVRRPWRYVFSFYGLVDLLAILPTYLSLVFPGTQYLLSIRILRLLRIFRILKLSSYISESRVIITALQGSKRKISVFLVAILTIVTVVGSLMYVVEGEENGFTDIPTSVYWAIVTLTTVGYGDLSPKTGLGKFLASCVMIMGYGIIAVPTGIVTGELIKAAKSASTHVCPECHAEPHDIDAIHCKYCGAKL
ncbi:MAG: ion transporter [Blastocatellia bacterium]|nr:ion transporter [Chloracidobacterium sp.]MBL8184687.1 ion transporter [Blastocatellia bacterium]HRJ90154.1 ion transporter [Pyrinomonadaceae bacterium]HRK49495.1 ion transporter [Pyrinomonadaceae bacterium]